MSTIADKIQRDAVHGDGNGLTDLVGLSRAEMEAMFAEMGLPKFRVKQVWH